MTLEKLTITPLSLPGLEPAKDLAPIEVLFNPTSYSITKQVTWRPPESPQNSADQERAAAQRTLNAPILVFGGGSSRTLTLDLFFNVTEPIERKGQTITIEDVRDETNKIVKLTRIQRGTGKEEPPPVCEVSWGKETPKNSDFPFIGVVTNLTQNFTLFKRDGRPVRANLTVQFTEFLDPEKDKLKTDPELTTHLVKRGDTLSSIAAGVYRNPMLWRMIAEENRLDDPRHLEIGQLLRIPKLR
jgi:nucleoid-associated protein YgaU